MYSLYRHKSEWNMKRTELAQKYFPDKTPTEAVRTLRRWINRCPELKAALNKYNRKFDRTRDLTIAQVRLIERYLCEP